MIQDINNDKMIDYNYYNINARRILLPNSDCQYYFPGKENEPNIIITEGNYKNRYVSNKLYVFSKKRNIDGVPFDGELVIEHTPSTNSNKKLYACFPLKTNARLPESTMVDKIIENLDTNLDIDIHFDTILPTDDYCIYHNMTDYEVLYFIKPIEITKSLSNIHSENQLIHVDTSSNYEIILAKKMNPELQNINDNAIEVALTQGSHVEMFSNIETPLQKTWNNTQEKLAQWSKYIFSGKMFDFLENSSPEEKHRRKIQKLIRKMKKENSPEKWSVQSKIENFVESMAMEDDGGEWMECENVPIDYSGEVATYNINASSKTTDQNSNLLLKTLQIFWIIVIVIFLYAIIPFVYGFLAVRSILSINVADVKERQDQITGLEMALSLLIIIPAFILLIYGYNHAVLNTDGSWKFNSQNVINCVVTGGIMFFLWLVSLVIIYFKKVQDPNFLGYQNGNLKTPYFTFGQKADLYGGLNHIFTSIVAIFKNG